MDFQVAKDDLHRCRCVDTAPPEFEPGRVLLEVAAMVEGAIRHDTTMDVEANHTDSHGQSDLLQ